jgi:hypothetical protein
MGINILILKGEISTVPIACMGLSSELVCIYRLQFICSLPTWPQNIKMFQRTDLSELAM